MVTALLLSSLTLSPAATPAFHAQVQAPVQVWLNKQGHIWRGDRVRVYARAEVDGYLLILHAEPDGRVRVLFPLDPYHDTYVRGDRDFEIRGRGDREAFRVYESSGAGTVFAAFSRDPFDFSQFVQADHWDYRLLDAWRVTADLDPEAELTALVSEMAGGAHFDYDLTHYYVGEQVAGSSGYYGDYYGSRYYRPYVGLSFGWWDPWYWRVGFSWGRPYHWAYDPWYDPWWDPYWYGYYPMRYRSHYYYGYDRYYYGGRSYYRYPRTYYAGGSTRGRYTFKTWDRSFADGGITVRRRYQPRTTSVVRSTLSQRATTRLSGQPVRTTSRRVAPTADRTTGRRTAPANTQSNGRRVQPSGWGITDGRRTIQPTERSPDTRSAERRRVDESRDAQVQNGRRATPEQNVRPDAGVETRRVPSPKRETIETRRGTSSETRTRAPDRSKTQVKTQSSERQATPSRTTPQRRATPTRQATPQRSTPSRAQPQRSTPTRKATPTRSSPSRAQPQRSTPTRKASPAPRQAPTRRASPAPRAPSRPSTRSAPRPSSRPSARPAPSRGSSRSGSARRPKN